MIINCSFFFLLPTLLTLAIYWLPPILKTHGKVGPCSTSLLPGHCKPRSFIITWYLNPVVCNYINAMLFNGASKVVFSENSFQQPSVLDHLTAHHLTGTNVTCQTEIWMNLKYVSLSFFLFLDIFGY